jgi:plastocyanin
MRVPPIVVSALCFAFASVALVPGASASREAVVYITSAGFSPSSLTLPAGDRVRLTVRDHKSHQIAKTSGPNSGDVAPDVLNGQGYSVTLMPSEPGTYTYIDRLNPKRPEFRLVVRAPH